MPSLNRIQLIGRLGKDPEVRINIHWQEGLYIQHCCQPPLEEQCRRRKRITDWFNVEAWGHLGEICKQYLHKGRLIFLEGQVRTDRYDREGETRYFTKVIASQMQMLDRKAEDLPTIEGEEPTDEEELGNE